MQITPEKREAIRAKLNAFSAVAPNGMRWWRGEETYSDDDGFDTFHDVAVNAYGEKRDMPLSGRTTYSDCHFQYIVEHGFPGCRKIGPYGGQLSCNWSPEEIDALIGEIA